MTTYAEKLRDPRWQRVRLEKQAAVGWRCEICGDGSTMLSVHHKRYVKGRAPWEYPTHELAVLCQPCHEEKHHEQDAFFKLLAAMPVDDSPRSVTTAYAVVAGFVAAACEAGQVDEAAGELEQRDPYSYACGHASAAFAAGKLTIYGIHRFADAMSGTGEHGLAKDLEAVFENHGMLAKGLDRK
jgi:hypothetical protein